MKINKNLTLVVCLAISISACSPKMTAEQYLAQATELSEKRDYKSAIIALKNAAKLDVKNASVRYYLGATYLAQGDYFSAEKELEKAETLGSDNGLLIANLVQVKLKLSKFDYVYQIAEQSQAYQAAEQVTILTYAGIASIYQGKPAQAKEYIEQAISISEDSIYGNIGKAYLSHSSNNYQNGLKIVDELLVSTPDFEEAVLLKGYLLQASGKYNAAAKTFEQYSKLRPKDIQSRFFTAQNYVLAQDFELAETHVDLLLKISKFHPLANQLKAEIEYSKENFKLAMEHAVVSFQQDNSFNISKIIAGISAYKLGDFEQSYQYLISVKDILPPQHLVRKLIIDLQLQLGYDTEAVKELQSLADLNAVDSGMLTMASNQMIASGNIEAAKELLQSSIAMDTSTPRELTKQGVTQLRLNQTEQAIVRLEQALKLDPKLAFAEQNLAIGYVGNKQYIKALEIAGKWQQDDKKIIQGYLLESLVLDKQKKLPEAKVILENVLELDRNNVPALYKLATYAHQEKKVELAFDFYTQVLKLQSKHLRAISNFSRLIASTTTESDEYTNKALDFYHAQLESQSENNSIKLGLAFIYRIANNTDEAIKLLKEIANSKTPLKGIEIALADSYKEQKNFKAAIIEYQKFVDANPKSIYIAHKLFALFEQTNQLDKAIIQVDKALFEYQDHAGLLLLKSYYKSKLKMAPNQSDLVKIKANEASAKHWLLDVTLGNFSYHKKDFNSSAKFYANAYSKEASDENVINWSKSTHLKGDTLEALLILEKHLKQLPDGQSALTVKVILAEQYTNNSNFSKAILLYESILKEDSENIIALNNLSYLKLQEGNTKQSLSYAKRAVVLRENNVIVIDTYALALVANKQLELALEFYDKAMSLDETNVEIRIHKAEALIANHQLDLAKSLLMSLKAESEEERMHIKNLLDEL
jgi:putative PEP-CTERM system TPR-repeat lipoprotein